MERCPTCQARLRDGPGCPRCHTDLTGPLSIEARAESQLRYAVACLAADDRVSAQSALERSLACHRTPLARLLYAWLAGPDCGKGDGDANTAPTMEAPRETPERCEA